MVTFWQKVKLWTRIIFFGALAVLGILLLAVNWDAEVSPKLNLLFKTYDKPRFLLVTLLTSIFSIFGWWLFWVVFRTLRQLRTARDQGRIAELEKRTREMEEKAAKLQTRPDDKVPPTM